METVTDIDELRSLFIRVLNMWEVAEAETREHPRYEHGRTGEQMFYVVGVTVGVLACGEALGFAPDDVEAMALEVQAAAEADLAHEDH